MAIDNNKNKSNLIKTIENDFKYGQIFLNISNGFDVDKTDWLKIMQD